MINFFFKVEAFMKLLIFKLILKIIILLNINDLKNLFK